MILSSHRMSKPSSRSKSRSMSNSSSPYKSRHKVSQQLVLDCPITTSPLAPWSSLPPKVTVISATLLTGSYQVRSTTATKRPLPSCLKKISALSIIHEGYENPPSFVPPTTSSLRQLNGLLAFESRPATAAVTTGASRPRVKTSSDEAAAMSEYTPRQRKCYWRVALAVLGPLFVCTSMLAQANGTLSNAVELAHVKHGYRNNAAYTKYVDNVTLFVPCLSKLFQKVRPKAKDRKKSWRITPERSRSATASVCKDKPSTSYWLSLMSTSDWLLLIDPSRESKVERTTKSKQSRTRTSKEKVGNMVDGWKIPRLLTGSESKAGDRKGMWRLDHESIFL
jgi:hypothetical protein